MNSNNEKGHTAQGDTSNFKLSKEEWKQIKAESKALKQDPWYQNVWGEGNPGSHMSNVSAHNAGSEDKKDKCTGRY